MMPLLRLIRNLVTNKMEQEHPTLWYIYIYCYLFIVETYKGMNYDFTRTPQSRVTS